MAKRNPRMVIVNFRIGNPAFVPASVARFNSRESRVREDRQERDEQDRTEPLEGEGVSLRKLFFTLVFDFDYRLVDAAYQQQTEPDPSGRGGGDRVVHLVKFVFVPKTTVDKGNALQNAKVPTREGIIRDFIQLVTDNVWSVRVYENPFLKDGLPVRGQRVVRVNCAVRQPLVESDGSSVMVWPADEGGRKVKSGAKVPLTAKRILDLKDGVVRIMAAPQAAETSTTVEATAAA